MGKTVINENGTIDQSGGTGLEVNAAATFSGTVSMLYGQVNTVQALVASASITNPGVYTVSNTTAAGYFLPNPSTIPGGTVVVRTLGTAGQIHFLTGAASDTLGTFITDGTLRGSKLSLASAVGSSVSLLSDGLNFCVIAKSGSLQFAGT